MFLKLSSNEQPGATWNARVYIRKLYDHQPASSPGRHKFFPWVERDPQEIPFAATGSKQELEAVIYGAQVAVLNPRDEVAKYLPANYKDMSHKDTGSVQTKFSPNVVCIDISGPGLPQLSFYDLPGIIKQVENDDESFLVDLVHNLVEEYVKDPDALIILACSLESDIQVSSASSIASKLKARPRCVGKLLPDRWAGH